MNGQPPPASIGAMIAALGTPGLPAALAQVLRATAPYDYTVIFGCRGGARPRDLFDDFPRRKRRIFVTDYQAGPYLLDPFYLAAIQPVPPALYRMRDLAPDRFYQGEYFRNYYVKTGLAEEIGYFVDIGGGTTVVVSLMREKKPFSAREFAALEAIRPVIEPAVIRHWTLLPDAPTPTASDGEGVSLQRSFQDFAKGRLTARERQVVEYTLKGYSAEALGRVLQISPGTVRIHRRNIYAKLGISSQGELFGQFIGTLAEG